MPTGPESPRTSEQTPTSWAAIGLACAAAVLLVLSAGGLGGAGAGAVLSFIAFVLAVVSRMKGDRWALLWFPLLLFPALLVSSPFWV